MMMRLLGKVIYNFFGGGSDICYLLNFYKLAFFKLRLYCSVIGDASSASVLVAEQF